MSRSTPKDLASAVTDRRLLRLSSRSAISRTSSASRADAPLSSSLLIHGSPTQRCPFLLASRRFARVTAIAPRRNASHRQGSSRNWHEYKRKLEQPWDPSTTEELASTYQMAFENRRFVRRQCVCAVAVRRAWRCSGRRRFERSASPGRSPGALRRARQSSRRSAPSRQSQAQQGRICGARGPSCGRVPLLPERRPRHALLGADPRTPSGTATLAAACHDRCRPPDARAPDPAVWRRSAALLQPT